MTFQSGMGAAYAMRVSGKNGLKEGNAIYNICLVGNAAVYAGRPGKHKKKCSLTASPNSSLIEDWHRCVKHLTVSSRESQAHRLVDGMGGYWQSSGSQGKVTNIIYSLLLTS